MATDQGYAETTGTGPEYEYPTTNKDEPIPVLAPDQDRDMKRDKNAEQVAGEDAPEFTDEEAAEEEKLEAEEAGKYSESMTQNVPQPGEQSDLSSIDTERLPDDAQ
eukprot:SM000058S18577  [mRNA]  locus=s58:663196:663937:- [translate_table: standard]